MKISIITPPSANIEPLIPVFQSSGRVALIKTLLLDRLLISTIFEPLN